MPWPTRPHVPRDVGPLLELSRKSGQLSSLARSLDVGHGIVFAAALAARGVELMASNSQKLSATGVFVAVTGSAHARRGTECAAVLLRTRIGA